MLSDVLTESGERELGRRINCHLLERVRLFVTVSLTHASC